MAIDKNKTSKLLEDIDKLYNLISKPLPKDAKKFIEDKVMAPLYEMVNELIVSSRAPIIFTMGRSGHGKSSLINALANREVAEVGDIKPTTAESVVHEIKFEDKYSNWTVIDSRGIFETTTPEGGLELDVEKLLIDDIIKYKPDIILHVINATEVRNLANDLKLFERIKKEIDKKIQKDIPVILVLNKVDTLGNPRHWPISEFKDKEELIKKLNEYMLKDVLDINRYKFLDDDEKARGIEIINSNYLGIVPVCSLREDEWNIDTLSNLIGKHIPNETLLDFYQAQGRKDQLRELSDKVINLFSTVAGGIALSPIPIADTLILTPLQLLMISIIGGLSCKEFSKETAFEYLAAAGINLGAAMGLRTIAQQVSKLVPGIGSLSSSAIAASGTFAIGKSAEAYFFGGEIKSLKEYQKEYKEKEKEK